jgi:hypothetical protein
MHTSPWSHEGRDLEFSDTGGFVKLGSPQHLDQPLRIDDSLFWSEVVNYKGRSPRRCVKPVLQQATKGKITRTPVGTSKSHVRLLIEFKLGLHSFDSLARTARRRSRGTFRIGTAEMEKRARQ